MAADERPPVVAPAWLEPLPDRLLDDLRGQQAGSQVKYPLLESVELAFIVALQQLDPRDRAVLVLRDVLGFRPSEVAGMLDSDVGEIGDTLERARTMLGLLRQAAPKHQADGSGDDRRALAERFACALERGDAGWLAALLSADARLSVPTELREYRGAVPVAAILAAYSAGRGVRLLSTKANGQPAFGCYVRDPWRPIARVDSLIVLTVGEGLISVVTRFVCGAHHPSFELPAVVPMD
ncbi:sigma factor-like helix-turn-helix DNA-binding protein [Kribbella sp. NPDC000426]|uniref:sigma factor-like helix-turn-helix DNA-binding protein n=1 Tax=Kribbella sp. NPDC000426 TaxID=3154255 RepID=UPI0033275711